MCEKRSFIMISAGVVMCLCFTRDDKSVLWFSGKFC